MKGRQIIILVAFVVAEIAFIFLYPDFGAIIIALGIGNDSHFHSPDFQLERAQRLVELPATANANSLPELTHHLLPMDAGDARWSYGAGDDSWLVSVATLTWREGTNSHRAQWVIRYCLDWKWNEHFVEAAALNDDAHTLTPALEKRYAIYGDGKGIPFTPVDQANCMWY